MRKVSVGHVPHKSLEHRLRVPVWQIREVDYEAGVKVVGSSGAVTS